MFSPRSPLMLGCLVLALLWPAARLSAQAPPENRFFQIQVVDDATSRGVPLVELRTVNEVRHYTDSNGIVAFYEPGLMGQRVFFFVSSHGYEFPKDGFGMIGRALDVREGGRATLRIKRVNIAERLYRITGAGIYRDSILVGAKAPLREPLLNAQVTGQDSAMAVVWRDRIRWFWGDTGRPAYPLGLFEMSGATSRLPGDGGLDPSVGIDLEYFVDQNGFSRAMCPIEGPGPVWIDGLVIVPDGSGEEKLVCHYSRMKDLGTVLEEGMAVYDEKADVFLKHAEREIGSWRVPKAHPRRVTEEGVEYYVFPTPYATARVRATLADVLDPSRYEAFTCLAPGAKFDKKAAKVERDADGRPVYDWKRDTDPIDAARERALLDAGSIRPEEARYQTRDADSGASVVLHAGSISWNAFRKKYILIANQIYGKPSMLGEVFYAEADAITGPWPRARKIATHDRYSFYNPVHHALFDQEGGRLIYFEGTYSALFSREDDKTPRYDYNQIMYRLDLADPRLKLPAAKADAP